MDYNATRKPELIKLLKKSQKNETRLAVKASRLEKQLDNKKVEYQNYINNSETLDAELRAKIDDLEKELTLAVKERCPHDYQLFRSQNSELIDRVTLLRAQIDDFEITVGELRERIKKQSIGMSDKNVKIADLEKQLADVSKTESGAKVEFKTGDRVTVKYDASLMSHEQCVDSIRGAVATVENVDTCSVANRSIRIRVDGYDWSFYLGPDNLRHAEPPAPPAPICPSCATKQKQVEELSRENEALNQTFEDARLRIEELDRRVVVVREREDEVLADYDSFKTAVQDELGYANDNEPELIKELEVRIGRADELQTRIANQSATIESYAADMDALQNRIALDKSSILRLTRELSAALLGGGE
jgi:chromosome segregation ATPase